MYPNQHQIGGPDPYADWLRSQGLTAPAVGYQQIGYQQIGYQQIGAPDPYADWLRSQGLAVPGVGYQQIGAPPPQVHVLASPSPQAYPHQMQAQAYLHQMQAQMQELRNMIAHQAQYGHPHSGQPVLGPRHPEAYHPGERYPGVRPPPADKSNIVFSEASRERIAGSPSESMFVNTQSLADGDAWFISFQAPRAFILSGIVVSEDVVAGAITNSIMTIGGKTFGGNPNIGFERFGAQSRDKGLQAVLVTAGTPVTAQGVVAHPSTNAVITIDILGIVENGSNTFASLLH